MPRVQEPLARERLARMVEGILLAHGAQHFQEWGSGLFDITIAVDCSRCTLKI
jgi:hypothetical protein